MGLDKKPNQASQPVEPRVYYVMVDSDGYVCNMQYDKAESYHFMKVQKHKLIDHSAYQALQEKLKKAEARADAMKSVSDGGLKAIHQLEEKLRVAVEELKQLELVNVHGCATGDCPHEKSYQCEDELTKEIERISSSAKRAIQKIEEHE